MKFFKYFLAVIIVCVAALFLLRWFGPGPDVVIVTESAVVDIPAAAPKKTSNAPNAAAAAESGIRLDFEAAKLGAVVGKIRVEFAQNGHAYEINISARASGAVKNLGTDKLYFKSAGKIAGGKMRPDYFSDVAVKAGKNGRKKDKVYTFDGKVWTHTLRGEAREVDSRIFAAAADPLTLMFQIARGLDAGEKCDTSANSFADRTGFRIDSLDMGARSESGIKVFGSKITETRCDISLWNRAGKIAKDFPFLHEFAKKKKKVRANSISIYYSKLGGGDYIPVFFKVRATPIGDIDIKLVKFTRLK